jgi:O-antigen ligase
MSVRDLVEATAAVPMLAFVFLRLLDIARRNPARYLTIVCSTVGVLSTTFGYLATGEQNLPGTAHLVSQAQTVLLFGFAFIAVVQSGPRPVAPGRLASQRALLVVLVLYLMAGWLSGIANSELTEKFRQSIPWAAFLVVVAKLPPIRSEQVLRSLQWLLMLPVSTSFALLALGDPRFLLGDRRIASPVLNFRLAGVAVHPNILGTVAVSAFIVMWFGPGTRWWRGLLMLVCALVVWATDSRIAIAALAVVGASLLYQHSQSDRHSYRSRGFARFLAFLAGAFTAALLWLEIASIRSASGDFSGRGQLWDVAAGSWAKEPLFGVGDNLLGGVSDRLTVGKWFGTLSHMHNQVLDSLTRTGLFGVMVFALMVGCLVWTSRTKGRALSRPLVVLVMALMTISIAEVPLRVGGLPLGATVVLALLALSVSREAVDVPVVPGGAESFQAVPSRSRLATQGTQ